MHCCEDAVISESPQGCQLQLPAGSSPQGDSLPVALSQGSFTAAANLTIWSPVSLSLQPDLPVLGALLSAEQLGGGASCTDSKYQVSLE